MQGRDFHSHPGAFGDAGGSSDFLLPRQHCQLLRMTPLSAPFKHGLMNSFWGKGRNGIGP